MDLAKEFIGEVLNERICLASNFSSNLFSSGNEKKNLTTSSCPTAISTNKQQELAMIEANKYLENSMSVSIHVLLGHSECKEVGDKMCSAMQDTEVWTFKLHHQRPPDSIGRPPMLPLFLKQALRSQLHFSPLRSWLTAKTLPNGLFPVVRVLASDHLLLNSISSQVQSHKFPACCCSTTASGGGGIWLELCVQWLKREYFLSKAPILCPSIEMDCNDSWVLPPLPDTNNGQNQQDEQVQRSGSSLSSSLCSSSDSDEDIQDEDENELSSSSSSSSIPPHSQININEQISHQKKDSGSEGEYNKNNNASCSNNLNNNSSLSRRNSQNIQTSSLQFVNEIQNLRERSQHHHRLRSSRPIQSSNNNNSTTINLPSLPKHSQLLQQYHHHHHQFIQRRRLVLQRARKAAKKINDGPSIEVDNKQNQKEDKMEEDKAEKVKIENKEIREENKIVNNNNGGIEKMEYSSPQIQQQPQPSSQCSTPPPPFHHPLLRGVNTTPRVLLQQRQHSSLSALHNNKNSNNSFRRCSSARLVCNFEESILSGRLTPSSIVDGYSLQLMVVPTQSMVMAPGGGFFSVQRVKYPVQTFFYFNEMGSTPDEISTRTPALLHLARCELDSDGIPIPRHCNLQAVLFNPQGSVIKIFMVEVDVRDMPNCSTTFIRQRTFSETLTTKTGINNNYFPSSTSSDFTANKNLNIKNNTGLMTSMMSSLTMPNTTNNRMPSPASALRFLIHLRLASNEAGCIRLHTDIRMLFSNKSTELEGLDRRLLLAVADNKNRLSLPPGILESKTNCEGSTRMHTIAEMPVGPKYSPVK